MRITKRLLLLTAAVAAGWPLSAVAADPPPPLPEAVYQAEYQEPAGPYYLAPHSNPSTIPQVALSSTELSDMSADMVAEAASDADGPAACRSAAPWRLPQPCFLARHGIAVGGWLEQGITFNNWNSDRFNGPVATNDLNHEYQLNQFWWFLDRPVKTDGCGWDIGGHIDASYGTDWRFGKNVGLEDRIDSSNSVYGLVLPQFYLAVGCDDLTVKMGHFAVGMSYEQVPSVANFFYSHSYAMSYGQPLLVTGLQADYKLNEHLTLISGVDRGWMMFEDTNDRFDVFGGVRWATCDQRTSLSLIASNGAQTWPVGGPLDERFCYSLVFDHKLSERFEYAFEHNLGTSTQGNPRTTGHASWYGLSNYFFYTLNPCWKAALRAEWFRDDGGSRVAGVGGWINSNQGWGAAPGFNGAFYELSAGLNWRPHPNFVLRPELRWDWYNGSTNVQGQLPFNNGSSLDQLTFATDLIFSF